MADAPGRRLPWLLVAASVLLTALLAYTLFAGYLPAKRRIAGLERELRDVYAREAQLQTRQALSQQQLQAVSAEREALARRVEELERQLAALRGRR